MLDIIVMNVIKNNLLHLSKRHQLNKIARNIKFLEFLSSVEIHQKRSELFSLEQQRQKQNVGRIEKIEVRYLGQPTDTTLIMNKELLTQFNCAQHLSLPLCNRSALELIDSHTPWDMHRPLEESSTLKLFHFTVADPHLVNKVFWRSCSFMQGAVLQGCIKYVAELQLHSFPSPSVKSGSFVHDYYIKQPSWQPNSEALRAISTEMIKLAGKNLKIERLEVSYDLKCSRIILTRTNNCRLLKLQQQMNPAKFPHEPYEDTSANMIA